MKALKKLAFLMAIITAFASFASLFPAVASAEETSDNVAAIGTTEYATLEKAAAAAVAASQADNGATKVTIELLKDLTISSTSGITFGTNGGKFFDVTVNGNGYTVTNTVTSQATIYVWMGKLTLNDMTINSTCNGGYGAIVSRDGNGQPQTGKAEIVFNDVDLNIRVINQGLNDFYLNNAGKVTFTGQNTIASNSPKAIFNTGTGVDFSASTTTVKAATLGLSPVPTGVTFVATTDPFDEAVAKIGSTNYATLEAAITAAVAQSRTNSAATVTVELLKDYTIASGSGLSIGANGDTQAFDIVIDGNGHTVSNTLTSTAAGCGTFYVKSGTTTIKDITIKTTNSSAAQAFGAIVSRYATAKVILENVNIDVDGNAGLSAMLINDAASLEFRGTNLIRSNFKAIWKMNGTLSVQDGSSTIVKALTLGDSVSGITFIQTADPFETPVTDPVAKIGAVGYASLERAVSVAVASSQLDNGATTVTIELLKDVTLSTNNGLILGTDGGNAFNVVINGNGHTVKGTLNNTTGDVSAIFYVWAGKLTLNNMTIDATCSSSLAFGAIISRQARSATANTGEEVILNNVNINVDVIQRSTSGSAIFTNNCGVVTFKGTNTVRTNGKVFIISANCAINAAGSTTTVIAPANMLGINSTPAGVTYVETVDPFERGVAAIGTTIYSSLADAFAAAKNGNVITLLKDIDLTANVDLVINSANIVLDGNGKTVTNTGSVVLEIKDDASEGSSSVIIKNLTAISKATSGTTLRANANTHVTLDNCTMTSSNSNAYGTICIEANAKVTVMGDTTVNAGSGTGIAFRPHGEGATLEIYNAKVTANYAVYSASAGVNVIIGTGADISTANTTFVTNANGAPTITVLGGKIKSTKTNAPLMSFSNANAKFNLLGGSFEGGTAIFVNSADTSKNISYPEGETSLTLLPTMTNGASIRLGADASGIRFRTTFSKALIDNINSMKDADTEIIYGTVIAPAGYIPKASNLFTLASLDACNDIVGAKYQNIKADKGLQFNADGSVTILASIVNIKVSNYKYAFAATGYICFTMNGETYYVYTDYSKEDNSRSVYNVACAAYADVSETQDETIYKYPISKYLVKNEDGTYSYAEGSAYSRFDTDQIKALDNYYNSIENYEYKPSAAELGALMQSMFSGNTVKNETVMFLDYGDEKTLLYPIKDIISVTSYDGSTVYVEGKDYSIVDGKIKLLAGSSIPCITREAYYNFTGNTYLKTEYNGQTCNTHNGEGKPMTDWQVNVSYTHDSQWTGFEQKSNYNVYEDFINKLSKGEDVTVFFYGDSITRGQNSSWLMGYAPYQYSYALLFTHALADLFDYTVTYVDTKTTGVKIPASDYVAGTRGTITYVNPAISGWTSEQGLANYDVNIKPFIDEYGCDLFVCAFGMNDKNLAAETTKSNVQGILSKVFTDAPDASAMIVSTMVPNPNSTNGWYTTHPYQEAELIKAADAFVETNKPCAVACMTSVSLAMLEYKEFNDISGNNINHPNDFLIRAYSQTLLQTLIGYENLE